MIADPPLSDGSDQLTVPYSSPSEVSLIVGESGTVDGYISFV